MASTTGGTAVAERPIDAWWLSTPHAPRHAAVSDTLPAVRAAAYLHRIAGPAQGVLAGLPGAVTDMAVSRDGRHLVAAHFGADAVSVIDVATLTVTATASEVAEPYALAAADRVYVRSASIWEDSVVAIDLDSGFALAAREIGVGATGLAASPDGDVLYVARSADGVVDIAVIDIESGKVGTIPVTRAADASIDTVRINPAGTRLYAALTTAAGGAVLVIDVRSGRVQTVAVGDSIGDIAIHRDDRRVFATGWDAEFGGVLRIVDTASARVVHTVAVSGLPLGVLAIGDAAYLAHGAEVAVLDTTTMRIANRIDIGRPVSCLAVSGDGNTLFVGDFDGAVTAMAVQTAGQGLRAAS